MVLNDLWTPFFQHLRLRRRSPHTLAYYTVTRKALDAFVARDPEWPTDIAHLTVTHLRAFTLAEEERGLKPGGVHGHVRALKSLFGWALREELMPRNPALRLERPTLPSQRLPSVEAPTAQLLITSARAGDQPLRDVALLLTLFDTGVRLAEVIGLKVEDMQREHGLLRVAGKGGRERLVPIGARALTALHAYLRRERHPAHAGVQHLFLNRSGVPMTRSCVSIRLARLAAKNQLGREEVAPHAFRRGFAVQFLRNGGDVFTLQQILGHRSLEMTRHYVSFLAEDLKSAHLRFSPGDRL